MANFGGGDDNFKIVTNMRQENMASSEMNSLMMPSVFMGGMGMGGNEEMKTHEIESLRFAALDTSTDEIEMIENARELFELQIELQTE